MKRMAEPVFPLAVKAQLLRLILNITITASLGYINILEWGRNYS